MLTLCRTRVEIDDLFDRRRQRELAFLDVKLERDVAHSGELEQMREQSAEDYNKLKVHNDFSLHYYTS